MGRGGEGGGSESESFKPQLNKKSIQMALEKEERERRALEEAGLVDESSDLIVAAGGGRGRGPEGAGERLYRSAILKKQLSYIESQQQAQTLTQRGGSGQGRMANGTKGGSLGRSSSFSGGGLGFGEQVAQAGAQTSTSIMNDKSRAILSKSKDIPQLGFLERQAHLAAVASERKAIYRSLVENAECTFRPALLVNSGGGGGGWDRDGDVRDTTWSRGDGGGGGGSFGGREGERDLSSSIAKLAYTDVRRSQALKEALADHYYGQLSFSPDINPKSRAMAKVR